MLPSPVVMWLTHGLLWCFYQLFELLNLFLWRNKLIYILDGLRVSELLLFFWQTIFLTILKLNPQHITFSAQDTRIGSSIGQAVLENAWMEIKFHITHNIFGWTIPVTFFFFVHSCWSFLKKCTKSQHRFFNRIRSSICLFLVITKAVTFLISWDSN